MTASSRTPTPRLAGAAVLALAGLCGCAPGDGADERPGGSERAGGTAVAAARQASPRPDTAVVGTLARSTVLADSIEELLRPLPLLRPAQEAALRRYSNAANLERARALGVRARDAAELASLEAAGRLVRLEDSTRHWVIRELDASVPYVTPDTRALLERLGAAFQDRLRELGLPAYRLEISSVLRTAADQAALRGRNVNAAAGASAHEFGTTVDLAYSAYAAPERLPAGLVPRADPGRRAPLEAVARVVLERVAARKSRELKAVLGGVLARAQADGEVLVTLEDQQPVYHITLAGATED